MAHRKSKAIMGCTEKQYPKVIERGASVKGGYYKRPDLYPNPVIAENIFVNQLDAASNAQVLVKGGGKKATTTRNVEVGKLFVMLRYSLLAQVNELYEGNRVKLEASGFGVSKEPSPLEIPDPPYIRRIEDANFGGSYGAKIILAQKSNPLERKKERYTYVVQISRKGDDDESYVTVLMIQNMHKLIVQGLKRGEEVYIRVARSNAHGMSRWSEPRNFIAR
jgi:hypothetical protein